MLTLLQKVAHTLYACLVFSVLAFALLFLGTQVDFFGYEVKVVQSGSMEPAIQTGSIVVVAQTNDYRTDDVITFQSDNRMGVPVTHRVVDVAGEGQRARYVTKGDANEEADSVTVPVYRVLGEVVTTVPYVGYLINFAREPLGFALLVGLPAAIIILDEFANIMWEIHQYRFRKRQGKVGYRTPSRERNRQQFGPKPPPKQGPPPPLPKKQQPRKAFDVGLPAYTHNRQVL